MKRGDARASGRDIREAVAPYWARLRAGRATIEVPRFVESLQSLADQGYSVTDIGLMFGLTGERVRQWFLKYNIKQITTWGSLPRLWDDGMGQFRVMTRVEYNGFLVAQDRRMKRSALTARQQAVRDEDVRILRAMARSTREVPPMVRLADTMGTHCQTILNRWRRDPGDHTGNHRRSYTEATDLLYATAGFRKPDGRHMRYYHRNTEYR